MSVNPLPHRLILLRFRPLWKYVDGVREFCHFFTHTTFDDAYLGERIGTITHELTENAIRYSAPSEEAELEITLSHTAKRFFISITNSTNESVAAGLQKAFDELYSRPAPEAYAFALSRARDLPAGKRGIGLPRVRFEGQVELKLEHEPGKVRVTAEGVL